ncbi:MAG TPA: MATE family efflux transporter [Myxococcota bacterium]|nr:MATE family efflux transporter [Myxococcota bacterium]
MSELTHELTDTTRPRGGLRELSWLAYPVVLSHLCGSAMHVTDSIMVGRLGATELAAVGYGGIWMWTALTLFMGTATGVQTFVSQADGAGDHHLCGRWTWQGFYAVAPITVAGVALFVAVFPGLLAALGPSEALREHAVDYVRARALGCFGLGVFMVLSSFFRGIGDTRTPLVASIVSTCVNVGLNYCLIFGHAGFPELGVAGAGLGTAAAEWTGATVLLVAFGRKRFARFVPRPVAPSRIDMRRFLTTSMPIGGQWFIEMSSFSIFSTLVAVMGDASMAASQALISLLSLSFMQAVGIGVASSTLVGRYVGAQDPASAERAHRTALGLGCVIATGVAALLLAVPESLVRLFTDDAEVIRLGAPLVRLGALVQVFDALNIIASGSLRGAGDTRWPFVVQSLDAWAVSVPLAWLVGVWLGYGVVGAWCALAASMAVLNVLLLGRFRSGAWRHVRI